MEVDDNLDVRDLFSKFFKVGQMASGVIEIRVDEIDTDQLQACGTITKEEDGLKIGDKAVFDHVEDDIWRVTFENDDEGYAVFVGEEYGGISIGS